MLPHTKIHLSITKAERLTDAVYTSNRSLLSQPYGRYTGAGQNVVQAVVSAPCREDVQGCGVVAPAILILDTTQR